MSTSAAVLFLIIGLTLLWKSADFLVSGAVSLANRLGISPLIIGLTIVAMGTSTPEVAASIAAAIRGTGNISLGNVYGSNVANLALVGGLAALIRPISVRLGILKKEIPVMVIVAIGLLPILWNLDISRLEGIILLVIFAGIVTITVIQAKRSAEEKPEIDERFRKEIQTAKAVKVKSLWISCVLILVGLAGLAGGAEITLRGAIVIGTKAGLSDSVIGLTIVAIGTSLPELATCIVAAFKKQDDISIGNLVGSNIFNTMLVVGTAGTIRPFVINPRLVGTDYWIMVAVSIVFMVMAIVGKKISRTDGAILLSIYAGYIVYLLAFTAAV